MSTKAHATSLLKTHFLKDYRPSEFLISKVDLDFVLHDDVTTVKSCLAIRRNPQAEYTHGPLILDGQALTLIAIHLDGRVLNGNDYQQDSETLTIHHVPDAFTIEIEVQIKPQNNTALMGLYLSRENYCTQCEAEGFRRITYYLDRPDVMSNFTTTIVADKKRFPYLLSNGNLIEKRNIENGFHLMKWEDPSLKPAYLFALVAGDFDLLTDQFETMSQRKVDLHLYVEKGFLDQAQYAVDSLKRSMKWDETRWGREYDLDIYMIVAVSNFNMGAMENKGLNIFNTKYILAKPETATDADYVAIENVIGHEYFHNWTGNRITLRNWFQLTLKEGLTVFRDQCFTEDMTSRGIARISTANLVRTSQFAEDAGPTAHPIRPDNYIEINNFYTLTVYRKGAEVIRMIETLISPELFRKGLDLYFKKYDGQAVTTEEFVSAMEEVSRKNLTQFRRWYNQAGTPLITITDEYDEKKQQYILNITQSYPKLFVETPTEPLQLPIKMALLDNKGKILALHLQDNALIKNDNAVLEIKKPKERFVFEKVPCKPVPSLLRHFSAPVNLEYAYSNEALAHLLAYDRDPFACWSAAQLLYARLIYQAAEKKQTPVLDDLFKEAFSTLLKSQEHDLNVLATLLSLPNHQYLLMHMPNKDVDALHEAWLGFRCELAKQFESQWQFSYQQHHSTEVYAYNTQTMGQRALKNLCLAYLVATGDETYLKQAYKQWVQSNNMTDSMGALIALNQTDSPYRQQALDALHTQWRQEPLVINKWLQLQASAYFPNTLVCVQALMKHESFHFRNPNNVYALIGGFAANIPCFHEKKGRGYEFIADQVIALDKENPQVAARVLQPLLQWRQVDVTRSILMKKALKRIEQAGDLSSDIVELVHKGLILNELAHDL